MPWGLEIKNVQHEVRLVVIRLLKLIQGYLRFAVWRRLCKASMALKFRPKTEKIVELMLYLAHKRPDADKYQAVKFFYLADREHLIRYGRPITFENYYAMEYGPVTLLGTLSKLHLQQLFNAVQGSQTMEGRHIKRVCNALKVVI
jgi:Protein of unknown function (DUF4065)